jgi:hypothetical protein
MHPPARFILLITAVALLSAAGPASAAVTAQVEDERLVVRGDGAADVIVLGRDEAGAVVLTGDAAGSFNPKTFAGIAIGAGDGDDVVTIATSLGDDPVVVEGGGGADELHGGPDGERLDGGEGDDRLDGAAGDDTLVGGAGADVFACGIGLDALVDRAPEDTVADDCDGDDHALVPRLPAPPAAAAPVPEAPVAADAGAEATPARVLTRAEVLAAAVPPGFAEPVLHATRKGLTVDLRNTSVSMLNVRITASEFVTGRAFGYRPVFRRLAPGARARITLPAPKRLARVLDERKGARRTVVASVVNAETNAQRTVEERFR